MTCRAALNAWLLLQDNTILPSFLFLRCYSAVVVESHLVRRHRRRA
jgi:hypothetical protein